ncbi:CAP domain-containing protein [Methanosphaerula subterraneus]|uniref:CAP domain-containing protein n=1 Tax=Methanosphaerula subterraneus TaxID=3350244 RepID=UPI003F8724BA
MAIIGIVSIITGLLLPIFTLDPKASEALSLAGVWFLVGAYIWYALNIFDLRAAGSKVTAILMLTIPGVLYLSEPIVKMEVVNNPEAAVSMVVTLALGSMVASGFLWLLSRLKREALHFFNRHERRKRWPSATWVIVCVFMISCYSLSLTPLFPNGGIDTGSVQDLSDLLQDGGLLQDPGIPIPTILLPAVSFTLPTSIPESPSSRSTIDNSEIRSPITISSPHVTLPQANGDITTLEQRIFAYTNQERQQQGLPTLQWDAALASIARGHSQDMVTNNFFSHTNLRGQDPTARASAAGYAIRRDLGGNRYSIGIGENIGKMPTGNVIGQGYVNNDPESIAQAMVQGWMESPGHRQNILNTQYVRIGVGVAYDGTYYFGTQNFI